MNLKAKQCIDSLVWQLMMHLALNQFDGLRRHLDRGHDENRGRGRHHITIRFPKVGSNSHHVQVRMLWHCRKNGSKREVKESVQKYTLLEIHSKILIVWIPHCGKNHFIQNFML